MSSGEWFYLESDRELGPVTQEQLLELLRSKLPRATLVWRDGLAEWMKAEDVPEIKALLAAPRPAAPRPPRISAAPVNAPARRTATTARVSSGEAETWNPFVLLLRCFQWSGRFSRVEFAIAYFGNIVLSVVVVLGVTLVVAALSGPRTSDAAGTAAVVLTGAWGLAAIVISLGSGIRRLHDLDKPGWWILGLLVPCLNFVMLLYFLFAPGATEGPGAGVPALIIVAALLILAVPVIGIVAAIAIPSLLRARVSANEAGTIGDVRSVISAQAVYQSVNRDLYASRLECLTRPGDCLATPTSSQFIDPSTIVSPKSGYVREFYPGAPSQGSATSTSTYAFLAYPVTVGTTGTRSFCGDSSGRICVDPRGGKELVETVGDEVRCSTQCESLR
jgi:type IV pilus assembly protein PilA